MRSLLVRPPNHYQVAAIFVFVALLMIDFLSIFILWVRLTMNLRARHALAAANQYREENTP